MPAVNINNLDKKSFALLGLHLDGGTSRLVTTIPVAVEIKEPGLTNKAITNGKKTVSIYGFTNSIP